MYSITWISSILFLTRILFVSAATTLPDLYEAGLTELQAGLTSGQFCSVELVKAYFRRIDEVNLQGPALRAIIETNPSALAEAAKLDHERSLSGPRSPLHGIPVLLKDNIGTAAYEGMNTTAGSWALWLSLLAEDAGVVEKLRKAGAIILGKSNLSEWAHFRGLKLPSGWSGRGGQCTNAYYPNGDPCGSSSGSAVAASIGLTAVSLGTETDGSITCPASQNNVVGIKPTVGLTSRAGVIPVSKNQDTVGPLARSVSDAAIVLSIIAGPDSKDKFTQAQPTPVPDYINALNKSSLVGKRIGVPRAVFLNDSITGNDPYITVVFHQALETLKELGAVIVDPADLPSASRLYDSKSQAEGMVLATDFKIQLNAWFQSLIANPSGVNSLEGVIKFNDADSNFEEQTGFRDQSILIASQATTGFNTTYYQALAFNKEMGAKSGIDAALQTHSLDALVLPATGFTAVPAAVAGYPIVTVPLGFYPDNVTIGSAGPTTVYPAPGVPVGLSFIGTAWSEYELIGLAYAYEQHTQTRLHRRAYSSAIPKTQLKDVMDV
ncbi:amidase signature enzyme [Chiua virens]|nr:amidase signature enzyme [Chiua virens]